jgi:hypothetical protein
MGRTSLSREEWPVDAEVSYDEAKHLIINIIVCIFLMIAGFLLAWLTQIGPFAELSIIGGFGFFFGTPFLLGGGHYREIFFFWEKDH